MLVYANTICKAMLLLFLFCFYWKLPLKSLCMFCCKPISPSTASTQDKHKQTTTTCNMHVFLVLWSSIFLSVYHGITCWLFSWLIDSSKGQELWEMLITITQSTSNCLFFPTLSPKPSNASFTTIYGKEKQ